MAKQAAAVKKAVPVVSIDAAIDAAAEQYSGSNKAVYRALLGAVAAGNDNAEVQTALNAARGGFYSQFIWCAAQCSLAEFEAQTAAVAAAVADKTSALGAALHCSLNNKGTAYKLPSAFSSAKSVCSAALRLAVPLVDDKGIRSFGAVRKEVQAAAALERAASLDTATRARLALASTLSSMAAALEADSDGSVLCSLECEALAALGSEALFDALSMVAEASRAAKANVATANIPATPAVVRTSAKAKPTAAKAKRTTKASKAA